MFRIVCLMLLFITSSLMADAQPDWILQTSRDGYVTGLGVGKLKPTKKHAEMFREKTAVLMAQAELVKQFDIFVDSETRTMRGSHMEAKISLDSTQTAISTLDMNKAVELERWLDPKTKTLYVLLGYRIVH